MKTSNILLLSAIAVAIICLVAYNFELKAEYLTIKKRGIEYYKDNRFNEYHQVKISKFENLDFLAANCIRVNVEYGEKEAVWVRKWDKDYIKVSQDGNTVSVSLNKKGMEKLSDNREFEVVIISPRINRINTSTVSVISEKDGRKSTTIKNMGVYNQISGFAQDSIQLNIASHVQMHLDKNEMQYLNIRVGDEKGDGSLRIASDNTIQSLKLNVLAKSTVEILDSDIQKIDHQLSEGAIVTFRGKVLSLLNN